jgi:hypothetical protein
MKIIMYHKNGDMPFDLKDVGAIVRDAQRGDKFSLAFRQKLEEALSIVEQYGEDGLDQYSINLATPEFKIAFISDYIPIRANSMSAQRMRELLNLIEIEQWAEQWAKCK